VRNDNWKKISADCGRELEMWGCIKHMLVFGIFFFVTIALLFLAMALLGSMVPRAR